MNRPLRIQADDPAVLARTGAALEASQKIHKAPLRLWCDKCGDPLAQAGDVPGYGPLFVSSWKIPTPPGSVVTVNGRELKARERRRWEANNYDTVEETGKPEALRDAVIALLALPPTMTQDYPDLLMRCDRGHGDYVANRLETLALLRQAAASGSTLDYPVTVGPGVRDYLTPTAPMPGGQQSTSRIVRKTRRTTTHETL